MEPGLINETDIPIDHTIFDNPLLEVPAIMGIPLGIHRLGTKFNNRADLDCLFATFSTSPIATASLFRSGSHMSEAVLSHAKTRSH
jgi:hypothetical protein